LPHVWQSHPRSPGMGNRSGGSPPLLGQASRGDEANFGFARMRREVESAPDLGDLVIVLLASTLAGLRDRLADDGFEAAADVVGDLVELTDDYITNVA
jgi:hypothetical protein